MDSFGRVVAVILVAILIFLFPLKYLAANQEEMQNSHIHSETVKFADEIILQGYLTTEMYNNYLYELDAADQLYDVEIIHGKTTEGYESESGKEDLLSNPRVSSIKGDEFKLLSTEKESTGGFIALSPGIKQRTLLNVEKSDSGDIPLEKLPVQLEVIPSCNTVCNGDEPDYTVKVIYDDNSGKIITDGYTKEGFTPGAGEKNVTFTYTENEKTVTTSIEILVKRNTKTCINGHSYELDDYDNDNGCPICGTVLKSISVAPEYLTLVKGSELPITITATYMDEHTQTINSGWTSNYDKSKIGNQLVTVTYEGKTSYVSVQVIEHLHCSICGKEYEPDSSGNDTGCPICSNLVVSIKASPDKIVLPLGEELELEVEATYKDGHKEVVSDWSANFNPFKVGEQDVSVLYESVTTKIKVIVESETETTCPICGTIYNKIIYPNGCPSCASVVIGIEARLKSGGNQVQQGSELSLAIILKYKDGSKVLTYNGWSIDGYQPSVLGKQTITVRWQAFTTTIDIVVVNTLNKVICPNGHVYYLNEDGSDPGCPYCNNSVNSFNSEPYYNCIYTNEILEELFENGIYYFNEGDYITIRITPRTSSYLQKLQNMFFATEENIIYSYGGKIHG